MYIRSAIFPHRYEVDRLDRLTHAPTQRSHNLPVHLTPQQSKIYLEKLPKGKALVRLTFILDKMLPARSLDILPDADEQKFLLFLRLSDYSWYWCSHHRHKSDLPPTLPTQ